jgi:hypothetical protein
MIFRRAPGARLRRVRCSDGFVRVDGVELCVLSDNDPVAPLVVVECQRVSHATNLRRQS